MKFSKVNRALHRDIGYLMVGLILIFSISGIILSLKKEGKDPAYKEIKVEKELQQGLSPDELEQQWNTLMPGSPGINKAIPIDNSYRIYLKGGYGNYNPETGQTSYMVYKPRPIVKILNNIHYNSGKNFTWLSVITGVLLIFLALSGAIILKGRNGLKKRGVWFIAAGIVVPVALYLIAYV